MAPFKPFSDSKMAQNVRHRSLRVIGASTSVTVQSTEKLDLASLTRIDFE